MVADRKDPSRTWSRDRAEQLMARYNAAVREELGIPEEWEDPWDE
jgi:aminoglycoside/choline kinase family phosphotransferase